MEGVSLKEAAGLLGVSAEKLKSDIRRGHFPAFYEEQGERRYVRVSLEEIALRGGGQKGFYQLLHLYLEELAAGVYGKPASSKHIKNIREFIGIYFKRLGKDANIALINPESFRAFLLTMKADDEAKRDYYWTKHNVFMALLGFMRYLCREKHIPRVMREDFRELKPKQKYKRVQEFPTYKMVCDFRKFIRDQGLRYTQFETEMYASDVLLCLYAFAGLRRMEAATLRLSDINWEDGYIRVWGKGNKERLVPLDAVRGNSQLRDVLLAWVNVRRKGPGECLVNGINCQALTESAIANRFKRLSAKFKKENPSIPEKIKFMPHSFRRAAATFMEASGRSPAHIQYILGHEDSKTTELYRRVTAREVLGLQF